MIVSSLRVCPLNFISTSTGKALGIVCLAAVSTSPVDAATVDLTTVANVGSVTSVNENGATVPNAIESRTVDSIGTDGSFSQTSTFSTDRETASSFVSADITTGVLRAAVSAQAETFAPGTLGLAEASANAYVLMEERLSVSGSGTVTVEMEYNGAWGLAGQDFLLGGTSGVFSEGWFVQGVLSFSFGTVDSFALGSGLGTASSGSISDVLRISTTVGDGDVLTIRSTLFSNINSGTNGFIDFSRTAYLSVFFSEGLTGTYGDSRFLTVDPQRDPDIGVIPLPAAGLLMLSSLGGLALLRRRRVS